MSDHLSYDIHDAIGRGATSTVYRVFNARRHVLEAAKVFRNAEDATNEMDALARLEHPNIVSILGARHFNVGGERLFGILFPLMGMNLFTLMQGSEYARRQARMMAVQTLKALTHVHDRGFIHMDIKEENVGVTFIADNCIHFGLLDFGSCLHLGRFPLQRNIRVTPGTYAPELLEGRYSPAADIFAMGNMFANSDRRWMNGRVCKISTQMSKADPDERPTSKQCLEMLGESMCLLWLYDRGEADLSASILDSWRAEMVWTHQLVNSVESKMDLFDPESYDASIGLQKLVTLVRSKDYVDIHSAFYLLHEIAIEETFGKKLGALGSVLSFVPYFLARLDVGPMATHFFCRAMDLLSHKPEFMLTDDIMCTLRSLSKHKHCERNVLCVMSRCMNETRLKWCQTDGVFRGASGEIRGVWGSRGDIFDVFVSRFGKDWNTEARNAALRLLRQPIPPNDMRASTLFIDRPPIKAATKTIGVRFDPEEPGAHMDAFFSSLPLTRPFDPAGPGAHLVAAMYSWPDVPTTPLRHGPNAASFIDYPSDNDEFLIELEAAEP